MTSLSNSSLWQSMHDYYNHMGPEAWTEEVVPFKITSNTSLAKLYTQLIIAQINDFITQHGNNVSAEPFHIIEIGAGHGKFSFYLLKTLCDALSTYNLPKNTILYIMSDISERNIESWRQHPAFKKYVTENILDFTYYNALTDDQIKLSNNNIIKLGQLSKPMFVLCNYLFDTLPHDAFQVIDGHLHEMELSIQQNTKNKGKSVANYFENISYTFKQNPVTSNYYENQNINNVLSYYQEHFENASFLIPVGGIQFLDKIREFTKSHLMLLLADKGVAEPALFDSLENPDIPEHGSVSMLVNFDALSRYVGLHKGISLLMPNKSADFQIGCFILNTSFQIPHTTFTFNSALSSFSLFDLFNICYKDDEPNKAFTTLEDLLAILNLAEWDPSIFYDYHPLILEYVEQNEMTAEQKLTLTSGLDKVWDYFFKLEKEQDIPFAIGILLYNIDEPEKAVKYYQYSMIHFGEQEETLYNIALAYQQLEEHKHAIAASNKAIQLNPAYKPAKELLAEYAKSAAECLC